MTPGKRLQNMRKLMGLTREEFAELVEIKYDRLGNLENEKVRMSVDDLEQIVPHFPEFREWLAYEGEIDIYSLQKSQKDACRLAATLLIDGEVPWHKSGK